MGVYPLLVMGLNFFISLLLLAGTSRIAGFPVAWHRTALAAALGAAYAGGCLLPGFRFLGSGFWRCASLGLMSGIAFGISKSGLRRAVLFVLLSLAVGGAALWVDAGGIRGVLAAVGVLLLCRFGFRGTPGSREYVPVELNWGGRREALLALRDTGNMLRDPVTGQSVLIVDATAAWRLLGLTRQQLMTPVETVAAGKFPGLRLIPYRTVGQTGGLLAALRMENVKIDQWQGSALVAFAPVGLDAENGYRALTGGMV